MTTQEKEEIISLVLNEIKSESQAIDKLPVADGLDGVNSLPAMQGQKLVSIPIEELAKPAVVASVKAEKAAESANNAAKAATDAAELVDTSAGKPNGLATLDSRAKLPLSQLPAGVAILPFDRQFESNDGSPGIEQWLTDERNEGLVVYIQDEEKFFVNNGAALFEAKEYHDASGKPTEYAVFLCGYPAGYWVMRNKVLRHLVSGDELADVVKTVDGHGDDIAVLKAGAVFELAVTVEGESATAPVGAVDGFIDAVKAGRPVTFAVQDGKVAHSVSADETDVHKANPMHANSTYTASGRYTAVSGKAYTLKVSVNDGLRLFQCTLTPEANATELSDAIEANTTAIDKLTTSVGDLSELETEEKESIVAAVNENSKRLAVLIKDYYYGIEWDITVSNPKPKRIGNMQLHRELPLQSKMRRCILNDDGSVNYYLHANDSTKKENGEPADLTGADGQYMVELPEMYVRFEQDGNICRCKQSELPLPGFHRWGKDYVSAVEATIQRSANKLASVCTTDADYRGGNNDASLDGTPKTQLGMPASAASLVDFRKYARKRGITEWNCYLYQIHRKLWWLFAVEYANFNSQDAFIAELDSSGFRQGGLSMGVTTVNGGKWSAFNNYFALIPCGTTNSLGNHSGVVEYALPDELDPGNDPKVNVPAYRGVENPFGHLWKWTDGTRILIQSEANGGLTEFYVCDDPALFSNSGVENYRKVGNMTRKDGFIKGLILGEGGEIVASSVGAGATTHFCDICSIFIPGENVAETGCMVGGNSFYTYNSGFLAMNCSYGIFGKIAYIGTRLCFYPKENKNNL